MIAVVLVVVLFTPFLVDSQQDTNTGINLDQASRRRCWSSGNGESPKWWDERSRIDRGRYWYECGNGELQPRGCFSETNERMFIYGKFVQSGYEMQCIIGDDGYLQFKYTGCAPDGLGVFEVGKTWEDNEKMYYFECRADGPYLRAEIAGCMTHDKTVRIPIGGSTENGDYWYECLKKFNGSVQMCSAGCMHNGQKYKIGDSWPDGDYVYYCKIENGRCQKICVGCQFRNKRLYDGDRYYKDDVVFQCEVRPDKYGHKPVGCVLRDTNGDTIERVVGCRWYQETDESKVEMTCLLENNKTYVKTLGCIYVHNGFDTLFVYPGTYTMWTKSIDNQSTGVACREYEAGRYRLETFQPEELAQKAQGLRYDQPRG